MSIFLNTRGSADTGSDVNARFERYAGGNPVGKKDVMRALPPLVDDRLPDFEYFKSRGQYRRVFAGGAAYINLEFSKSTLALRFGTRIDAVEQIQQGLSGSQKLENWPTTISTLSWNMGPMSRSWPYPSDTTWPITGSDGLQIAAQEVADFLDDVVRPYLDQHEKAEQVRETILYSPGLAELGDMPTKLFAIDVHMLRIDWLEQDFARFRPIASALPESSRLALFGAYEKARTALSLHSP